MSCFPQMNSGSIAQFPVTRSRTWRAILNDLESGEQIMLPDPAAGQVEWRLSYQDLTAEEVNSLEALFTASQGSFGAFTFIDPLANLLGWSESLAQPNWQPGLLRITTGVADPLGTLRASSLANTSAGTQAMQQTLGLPGDYVACFSLWLRSNTVGTVTLQRDGTHRTIPVGPAWKRQFVSARGALGASQSSFCITLAPAQSIDLWGLQVEAQPYPSAYKQTATARGIYEETCFETDELDITSTSLGLSSCDVRLISRVLT